MKHDYDSGTASLEERGIAKYWKASQIAPKLQDPSAKELAAPCLGSSQTECLMMMMIKHKQEQE